MDRRTKLLPIPKFASEDEESEFWFTHDTTDYMDWSLARPVVFPNLKPSTRAISIRLPSALIDDLKVLANKKDVPYQSLLKIYLSDKVEEERAKYSTKE